MKKSARIYRWECHHDRGSGLDREICNCKGRWVTLAFAVKGGQEHNEFHRNLENRENRKNRTVNVFRKTPTGMYRIEVGYDELNDYGKPPAPPRSDKKAYEVVGECDEEIKAFNKASEEYNRAHEKLGKALKRAKWDSLTVGELGGLANSLPEDYMDRRFILEKIAELTRIDEQERVDHA